MQLPAHVRGLSRPTLILDEALTLRKHYQMWQKALHAGVNYRPHFKTHQSRHIANKLKADGVNTITVSSVRMAEYFAADGWKDITVAFPFNVHESENINAMPADLTIQLVLTSVHAVAGIGARIMRPCNILLKVDTGYGRTGIPADDVEQMERLAREVAKYDHLTLTGFLAHAGHSYQSSTREEILAVHQDTLDKVKRLRSHFGDEFTYSVGDTPTCSIADQFAPATEIRPGNFFFYDVMMTEIGACAVEDISVCMAVPVVALHPESRRVIVHGGGVHFSKDRLQDDKGDYYGLLVRFTAEGWSKPVKGWRVAKLSQEHGTLIAEDDESFAQLQLGDWVGILPVHSCLTANLMKGYRTLSGEAVDHLEGNMPV